MGFFSADRTAPSPSGRTPSRRSLEQFNSTVLPSLILHLKLNCSSSVQIAMRLPRMMSGSLTSLRNGVLCNLLFPIVSHAAANHIRPQSTCASPNAGTISPLWRTPPGTRKADNAAFLGISWKYHRNESNRLWK